MTHSTECSRPRFASLRSPQALRLGAAAGILYAVYLISSARPAQAGINVWTSHGPEGGQVYALVIDPTTPMTLYAGQAAGGVFMSADGGDTWSATNAGLTNTNVYALAIDPSTPTTLYAGTLGGGVFKSTDGGATWGAANAGLNTTWSVWALAVDPTTPATLYAGTAGDGVFKSTNGGNTWSAANTGLRVGSVAVVLTLAIDPMTPTTLYATASRDGAGGVIESGVFKSSDGGGTWHATTTAQIDTSVWALAIDPVMPTTLYAVAEFGGGVFRSTDGAATWAAISAGPTEGKVFALVVDSTEPSTLYAGAGGAGVFTSTDGGSTWSALNTGLTNGNVFALAIDPVLSSHLYAATAGGVFDIEQVARGDGGGCAVTSAHRGAAWWLLVPVLVLAWVRRLDSFRWTAAERVAERSGLMDVRAALAPAGTKSVLARNAPVQ